MTTSNFTPSDFTPSELALIETEAKHCGFKTAEDFLSIEAGIWRLAILNNSGYFDGKIEAEAHNAFTLKTEPPAMEVRYKTFRREVKGHDPIQYLLFKDGSLYLDSNGEDEVWASATDFADEWMVKTPLEELHRAELRLLRQLGGQHKERAKAAKLQKRLLDCLEAFTASDDFADGCISATRAAYGGSGYSVELFRDGTWRVLWDNQIGNRYDSPGIILSLPTFESAAEGTETHEEEDQAIKDQLDLEKNEIISSMRESIMENFRQ